MCTRTLVAAVALLALAGCAGRRQPTVTLEPIPRLLMEARLYRVSTAIKIAARPLCEKTDWTLGLHWATPSQFPEPEIGKIAFSLQDGEKTIIAVAPNGPAARAGVRVHDILVSSDDNTITIRRDGAAIRIRIVPVQECSIGFWISGAAGLNAWGGDAKVVVSVPLMERATDDELALVLGHEVAHVIHKDSGPQTATNVAITAASIVAGSLGEIAARAMTAGAAQQREREADDLGLRLAAAAGYDYHAAPLILAKLGSTSGGWLADHPGTKDRLADLEHVATEIDRGGAKLIAPKSGR